MTIVSTHRDKSLWLLFLLAVSISGLYAFINLSEFVKIGILLQTNGYPFGGEGPTPWHYETPQLYARVNLIYGMVFFLALVISFWTFLKLKKKPLTVTLLGTLLLFLIQMLSQQAD